MVGRKDWRTVRVVVEVAAKGDYTEKDLRWAVARRLEGFSLSEPRAARFHAQICVPKVKEFGRFIRSKNT